MFRSTGLWLLVSTLAVAQPLILEGEVPQDGGPFFEVPFDVPAGTRELEVHHDDLSEENILDFGLHDAEGRYRGWGGGNVEPAIVGEQAASRSYLPGPLPVGTWRVLVGKAKVESLPARFRLEITLRDTPTLLPQSERRTYTPAAPLSTGPRWYAGDLHVHSRESGDARPSLDDVATFASSRGLDFVFLSDHNTVSHLDFIPDAQVRAGGVLLLPSVEFTTYGGHANGLGARRYVDLRLGGADGGIVEAVRQFHDQGALFSVNHPALELGNVCIGCAWRQRLPRDQVDAVEVQTGRYSVSGVQFFDKAVQFWESVLETGKHAPAVGGSDDHRGGESNTGLDSAIGSPTTLVFAADLSEASILAGLRAGRTVVKLEGPDDPMVELTSGSALVGDTVRSSAQIPLQVKLSGVPAGAQWRLVRDGVAGAFADAPVGDSVQTLEVPPSAVGAESRVRAELHLDGRPRSVTSHLYLAPPATPPAGCGCNGPAAAGAPLLLGAAAWLLRRRQSARRN
jgi:hypothetical protein